MLYIIKGNESYPCYASVGEVDDMLSLLKTTPVCTLRSFAESISKLPIHPDLVKNEYLSHNFETWFFYLSSLVEMYQEDLENEIENVVSHFDDMSLKNGIPQDPVLWVYDAENKVYRMNSEFIDGAFYSDISIADMLSAVSQILGRIAITLCKKSRRGVSSIITADPKFRAWDSIKLNPMGSKLGPLIDVSELCHASIDFESRDLKRTGTNSLCFVQDGDDFKFAIMEVAL